MNAGTLDRMPKGPGERTVKGKWFVPALLAFFVIFTLAMSYGTILLGKTMRPVLERRQIERQKAEMAREAAEARRAP